MGMQTAGSFRTAVGSIGLASVRDLQWRTRRFFVAAIATGLVFGVALMMSGISNSFSVEVRDTVAALGAQSWLVPAGSPGPFTDTAAFPIEKTSVLNGVPGVSAAAPLLVGHALSSGSLGEKDVNVLGVEPGRLGSPKVVEGRPLGNGADVVADQSLRVKVGQVIVLSGSRFTVVGLVSGVTYFAGQPVVFMPIAAADRLDSNGLPLATAILVRGVPKAPVAGFVTLSDAQVRTDLARPTLQAVQTIQLVEILLWLVAAGIIAAIIYLSALERRGDFAVLKAVGTPGWHLFFGLVVQALVMAIGAAVIGIAVEALIAPTAAMTVRVSGGDYAAVPIVAVVVGVIASILPARRAATVDPALAFGSAK
jgi:putative ABC transport system permease protein